MSRPPASVGEAEEASPIALERTGLGPPTAAFVLAASGVAGAAVVFLLLRAAAQGDPRAAEAATLVSAWPWSWMSSLGVGGLRVLSAGAVAVAVLATAFAGRRLLHSEAMAVLAALLVALDPALLAVGQAAYPAALKVGLGMVALAALTSNRHGPHWLGCAALFLLALVDAAALWWTLPLAMLVVFRGHVYAAPSHLVTGLVQCVAVPALGAAIGIALRASGDLAAACDVPRVEGLALLRVADLGGGLVAVPDPAIFLAGWAALLAIALYAIVAVGSRFRLQRLPGRLQVRLPEPLSPLQGRGLWLLLLALTVPHPLLAIPVLALGLAAGIGALGEDSPGFGLAVACAALLFAASFLVRAWPVATGTADPATVADLLDVVPWAMTHAC